MSLSLDQMRALSGQTTNTIYELICSKGRVSPSQIQRELRMRSKGVFYHLNKLRLVGLVNVDVEGRRTYYKQSDTKERIPEGFLGLATEVAAAKVVAAKLRGADRRFMNVALSSEQNPEFIGYQWILTATLAVSQKRFREFQYRLVHLAQEFKADGGETAVQLTLVTSPKIAELSQTQKESALRRAKTLAH